MKALLWVGSALADSATEVVPFDVTVTYCFTPEHKGIQPHHTSPPKDPSEFAQFCGEMTRRYAPAQAEPDSSDEQLSTVSL